MTSSLPALLSLRFVPFLTPHTRHSQPVLGGSGTRAPPPRKGLRRTLSEPALHSWEARANVGYDTEKLGALLDDVDRALFDSIKVDSASKGAVAAIKESIEAPTLDNIGEEKSLSPRRRPTLKCSFRSCLNYTYSPITSSYFSTYGFCRASSLPFLVSNLLTPSLQQRKVYVAHQSAIRTRILKKRKSEKKIKTKKRIERRIRRKKEIEIV